MNREPGWYHVKCSHLNWIVAGFDGEKWVSTYWVGRKENSFFEEIDERRIVREEPNNNVKNDLCDICGKSSGLGPAVLRTNGLIMCDSCTYDSIENLKKKLIKKVTDGEISTNRAHEIVRVIEK